MPDADGYELLRRVRALGPDRGGHVLAVALTAFVRADDRRAVCKPASSSTSRSRWRHPSWWPPSPAWRAAEPIALTVLTLGSRRGDLAGIPGRGSPGALASIL